MAAMKKLFPDVVYCDSPYEAIKDTDCIVVLTEWDQIRNIDFNKVVSLCRKKVVVDTRNVFDAALLEKYGFRYVNMGAL